MIFLQKENFEASFDFLKKAEVLSEKSKYFKALTYNNIACFYKTVGKYRVSLNYLNKALFIEKQLKNQQNIADIYLNICAVLSQLNKHNDALFNSMNSIILIQNQIIKDSLKYYFEKKKNEQENETENHNNLNSKKEPTMEERITILSIAYHNMGVELEYLNKMEDSVDIYEKAMNLSGEYLNETNPIINNLKNVYDSALNNLNEKKAKKLKNKTNKNDNKTIKKKNFKKSDKNEKSNKNIKKKSDFKLNKKSKELENINSSSMSQEEMIENKILKENEKNWDKNISNENSISNSIKNDLKNYNPYPSEDGIK